MSSWSRGEILGHLAEIQKGHQLKLRVAGNLPVPGLAALQTALAAVQQNFLLEREKNQAVRAIDPAGHEAAEIGQVPGLHCIPVLFGNLNQAAVWTQGRGTLPPTPFLHLEKTLTKRVGAAGKIFTGKQIAIPQTVIHLPQRRRRPG